MWAGFLALVNQQALANGHSPLGFINPIIYQLASGPGYGTAFHDITSGSNGIPATTGYDLATGLGSPNGVGLVNALAGATASPNFTLSASPASVSVVQGGQGTATITVPLSGGFNSAVSLSAAGQPSGVTVSFNPNPVAAAGSGTSTMTMTVAPTTVTGVYPITITGMGGGITKTTTVTLTVTAVVSGDFTLSASPNNLRLNPKSNVTTQITITPSGGFNGNVTLSASGMGSGVTASFTPNPTAGTSTLTLTAAHNATAETTIVTITGISSSLSHTTVIRLIVR